MGITGITYLAASAPAKSGGSNYTFILVILVVFVGFYFLMIRPQQRRRQQAAQDQNTVAPGARVRTTAGMYATVVEVDGDDVILEVAPGVEVRYLKRAIMNVVSPGEPAEEAYEEPAEEDEDAEPVQDEADVDTPAGNAEADAQDADSADEAYEKATGNKKD
jgi:preprotein translocase subunit YajC